MSSPLIVLPSEPGARSNPSPVSPPPLISIIGVPEPRPHRGPWPGCGGRATVARTETDSLGSIEIDAARYWGPQTERARRLFRIGTERFPPDLIRAVGLQKQAAAEANLALGELPEAIARPIIAAAREIAAGAFDEEFPLPVWQTGSGTQTNMNANEVIANRANELLGAPRGAASRCIRTITSTAASPPTTASPRSCTSPPPRACEHADPGARTHARLRSAPAPREWAGIVKIGRTHMMDAVPVTLGQEFAAWARQVGAGHRAAARHDAAAAVAAAGRHRGRHRPQPPSRFRPRLLRAASPRSPASPSRPTPTSSRAWARMTPGGTLRRAERDRRVASPSSATISACSAPARARGIAELIVPADGLSSSIMPGKTNPTQCEALTMVARAGHGQPRRRDDRRGAELPANSTCSSR